MNTLPDYLAPGLDIVFVGINPGLYSAQVGHYFASPSNRFWPAINRAGLLAWPLDASRDWMALQQGIGFTDIVKRPTRSASELRASDFRQGAPVLQAKLEQSQPRIVCFNGYTAYRSYLRYAEEVEEAPRTGLQPHAIGGSKVFLVPSPSAANASTSLDELASWYRRLKDLRDELKRQ